MLTNMALQTNVSEGQKDVYKFIVAVMNGVLAVWSAAQLKLGYVSAKLIVI